MERADKANKGRLVEKLLSESSITPGITGRKGQNTLRLQGCQRSDEATTIYAAESSRTPKPLPHLDAVAAVAGNDVVGLGERDLHARSDGLLQSTIIQTHEASVRSIRLSLALSQTSGPAHTVGSRTPGRPLL